MINEIFRKLEFFQQKKFNRKYTIVEEYNGLVKFHI